MFNFKLNVPINTYLVLSDYSYNFYNCDYGGLCKYLNRVPWDFLSCNEYVDNTVEVL